MIRSFVHKGLERFYRTGKTTGIQFAHAKRLRLILTNLDQAKLPSDMDMPGLRLHPLKGSRKGFWSVAVSGCQWLSVAVSGNWRITFRFIEEDVEIVNYEDYH